MSHSHGIINIGWSARLGLPLLAGRRRRREQAMIALALALAAVVGFAIQKGGLCAVLAVREVLEERSMDLK